MQRWCLFFIITGLFFITACEKQMDIVTKPQTVTIPGVKYQTNAVELTDIPFPTVTLEPVISIEEPKELTVILSNSIKAHRQYIYFIDFSPDGKNLASGSADKMVKIWDVDTGKEIHNIQEDYDMIWGMPLNYSPDGRYLIYGAYEDLKIADVVEEYEELESVFGHEEGIQSLECTSDSEWVWTAGVDGTVKEWSIPDLSMNREFVAHSSEIWNIAISPDMKYLITGGEDTYAKIWSIEDLSLIKQIEYHNFPIEYVSFTEDGDKFLLASADGTVSVWEMGQYDKPLTELSGHIGDVLVAIFSKDGNYVFSGGDDDEIYVYDIKTGVVINRLSDHWGDVMTLTINPDGTLLASGSRDRYIKIWWITYQ